MKNSEKTKNKKEKEENVEISQSPCGCGDIVNDFIEDVWSVMTPKMIDRLKCILKEDMGMSKQDVDKFIEGQREVRRQRICLPKNKRTVRIGRKNQWIKEVSKSIADQIAALVVGILLSNRTERTKRVTEKVLERLCEITGEDTTVESAKTRVERTLVVVADRMATWIDEAISDIEKTMQDKYMSAASLEALSVAAEECYQVTTDSSSDASLATHSLSHSSDIKSIATLSVVTTDVEENEDKRKVKDEKPDRAEKSDKGEKTDEGEDTDEKEGDKESKITKLDESSEDDGGTEDSTAKDEEEEVEIEEEEIEETEEEEVVTEEEEEDAESEDEEVESEEEEVASEEEEVASEEEQEVEEEEVEEEEVEALDEEELEEEETEKEDSVEDEGEGEEMDEKPSSNDNIKGEPDLSTDLPSEASSKHEQKKLQGDVLDLLKEDIEQLPREEEQSDRQMAMKKVIDKRLEKVAKDKLEQSLDSLVKYDIDKAASIVANWVENILAVADRSPVIATDYKSQGPAFEVKIGEGSQFEVSKISSTSVAKKVAEIRGLDPPLRKKKIPKTMSPMDLQSGKDWADWVLGAANVGEEWGKWLDSTLTDVEKHLLTDRNKQSHRENYDEWVEWRDKRAREAQKWRVEKEKIKDEGKLWNRKMKGDRKQTSPEYETLSHIY